MKKDNRYDITTTMYRAGKVKVFRDLFNSIPKSKIAAALGLSNVRFSRLMNQVEQFGLKDIFIMGRLFDLTEREMLDLVMKQWEADREANK